MEGSIYREGAFCKVGSGGARPLAGESHIPLGPGGPGATMANDKLGSTDMTTYYWGD